MTSKPLKTVLVVEDDRDIRMLTRLALEAVGGFTVFEAASGHEALEAARSYRPDLILLDVMMPDLDGPATLRHLRSEPGTAEIPVVFLTAKVLPAELIALRQLGALYVITKPFDPMTLATQLQEAWRSYTHER